MIRENVLKEVMKRTKNDLKGEIDRMVKLIIDDKEVEVKENTTVLTAAKKLGIYIPTLCYHSAVKPYGSCRLCLVEVVQNNRKQVVASCIHPVTEGLRVYTDTEGLQNIRRITVELLLARGGGGEVLRRLASQLGVEKVRFEKREEECILCGLCVRVCEEIVGIGAISFAYRGRKKETGPPFKRASSICVGCGTCVYVCPTGAIKLKEIVDTPIQHHWKNEFEKVKCRICGDYHLEPEYKSELLK
jgi:NADH dehydrogenase/NADH:ubiquinone oxidoreductase subunit G